MSVPRSQPQLPPSSSLSVASRPSSRVAPSFDDSGSANSSNVQLLDRLARTIDEMVLDGGRTFGYVALNLATAVATVCRDHGDARTLPIVRSFLTDDLNVFTHVFLNDLDEMSLSSLRRVYGVLLRFRYELRWSGTGFNADNAAFARRLVPVCRFSRATVSGGGVGLEPPVAKRAVANAGISAPMIEEVDDYYDDEDAARRGAQPGGGGRKKSGGGGGKPKRGRIDCPEAPVDLSRVLYDDRTDPESSENVRLLERRLLIQSRFQTWGVWQDLRRPVVAIPDNSVMRDKLIEKVGIEDKEDATRRLDAEIDADERANAVLPSARLVRSFLVCYAKLFYLEPRLCRGAR